MCSVKVKGLVLFIPGMSMHFNIFILYMVLTIFFFFFLQLYQLDRVALHDSKRVNYEHTKKCAENYVMLRETDRAVQLLLETEPDTDVYYTDCLR